MVQLFFQGFTLMGSEWVMWILMGLSIMSVALILERYIFLRKQETLGQKLWKNHVDSIMSGDAPVKSLKISELAKFPCVEGKIAESLLKNPNSTASEGELYAQSILGKERLGLEKNLSFLGTLGSNAPFIGLFGTVLGIIKAFHDLGGKAESAGAQAVSAGLSEALVATAVGLFVAIPAVVAFNLFQRKIKLIMGRAESLSQLILSQK